MSPFDPKALPDAARSADVPDPDAPPSEQEIAAAALLRDALDRDDNAPDAELVKAIRAAIAPSALPAARHERILESALAAAPPGKSSAADGSADAKAQRPGKVVPLRRPAKIVYLAWGIAVSAVAAAAAMALVVRPSAPTYSAVESPAARPLALSRSAADLFPQGIPVTGKTTERIDRIAYARAQDLRENEFARWGVR